jgi:hypothetical protein
MESRVNRRIRFINKWSPRFLSLALLWLFLSLRHTPVSIPYLITCAVIGILCGGLIIVDYSKKLSPPLFMLWMTIFVAGKIVLPDLFFSDVEGDLGRKLSSQYVATVLVSILALVLVLRRRIMKFLCQTDVELVVAPARGSRVS